VRKSTYLALILLANVGPARADIAKDAEQHGDVEVGVVLDQAAQSGRASATIRIHARRDLVWGLIKSCTEAVKIVPGLVACTVLETGPDQSWEIIRQVLDYSWYVPKLTYELRATYDDPERVSIERISGDLRMLKGSWYLQSDGEDTIAHYVVELSPGFWVPHWIVRVALRHDLPKMLRALRARAESVQQHDQPVGGQIETTTQESPSH
jgi:Polyketide cyclase / dehydrase and lipid transport